MADPACTYDGQSMLTIAGRTDQECALRFPGKELLRHLASDRQVPVFDITMWQPIVASHR